MDATSRNRIEDLTRRLRSDTHAFWTQLRTLLREKDVDPDGSLLVECFPDDPDSMYGLVVAPDRSIFHFHVQPVDLDFGGHPAPRPHEPGAFTMWQEITGRTEHVLYRAELSTALGMLPPLAAEGESRRTTEP